MPNRMMTCVIMTNAADKIHAALGFAATAASMGRPVQIYFIKDAIKALLPGAWAELQTSSGELASEMDARLEDKGIGGFDVLVDALATMDVRFLAAEAAAREHDIHKHDLITRPPVDMASMAEVVEAGAGGDWLTF